MKYFLITIILLSLNSYAEEYLKWNVPDGWKIGYQKGNIIELVKNNENVESWNRLITLQQYQVSASTNVNSFIATMHQGFIKSCADSELLPLKSTIQGGFQIEHLFLTCTTNKLNGLGEIYQIKTIKGKEKLYVVQYAYRVEPYKKGEWPLEESEAKETVDFLIKLQAGNR